MASAADADGSEAAFRRIIFDGNASVFQELGEGRPAAEAVTEGFGEIAFAGDAGELGFGLGAERPDHELGAPLADGKAAFSGLNGYLLFDVVYLADAVAGLASDPGFGGGPDVTKVAPQMGRLSGILFPGALITPFESGLRTIQALFPESLETRDLKG